MKGRFFVPSQDQHNPNTNTLQHNHSMQKAYKKREINIMMTTNTTIKNYNKCKHSLVEYESHSTTNSLILEDACVSSTSGEEAGRMIITIEDINRMQADIDAKQQRLDHTNKEELALDQETLDTMRNLLERNDKEQLEIHYCKKTTESFNFRSCHSLTTSSYSIRNNGSSDSKSPPPRLELKQQENFKSDIKMNPLMKGVSALNVNEFHKYDTEMVIDSTASPSYKMNKASK
jgi:hypothetical protein